MQCPKCNATLGCSCMLRYNNPQTKDVVIGCTKCAGRTPRVVQRTERVQPNKPTVNRAYWTRGKI